MGIKQEYVIPLDCDAPNRIWVTFNFDPALSEEVKVIVNTIEDALDTCCYRNDEKEE